MEYKVKHMECNNYLAYNLLQNLNLLLNLKKSLIYNKQYYNV
jgi:AAA+ ATPase superfamily predicted ATPase